MTTSIIQKGDRNVKLKLKYDFINCSFPFIRSFHLLINLYEFIQVLYRYLNLCVWILQDCERQDKLLAFIWKESGEL